MQPVGCYIVSTTEDVTPALFKCGEGHCTCVDVEFDSVTEKVFKNTLLSKNTLFGLYKTFDSTSHDFPVDKTENSSWSLGYKGTVLTVHPTWYILTDQGQLGKGFPEALCLL